MAKLPQSCGTVTAVGALGPRNGGTGGIKPRSQRSCRQHREPGPAAPYPWRQGGEAASCTGLCTAGRHGAGCGKGQGAH